MLLCSTLPILYNPGGRIDQLAPATRIMGVPLVSQSDKQDWLPECVSHSRIVGVGVQVHTIQAKQLYFSFTKQSLIWHDHSSRPTWFSKALSTRGMKSLPSPSVTSISSSHKQNKEHKWHENVTLCPQHKHWQSNMVKLSESLTPWAKSEDFLTQPSTIKSCHQGM